MEKSLQSGRNCPLSAAELQVEKSGSAPSRETVRSKYAFVVNKKDENIKIEERKKEPYIIKHGNFEFTECPVPILTEDLMEPEDRFANLMVDLVNWSEATGCMPVPGGLLDQSNVYFESRKIILSEQNLIEYEKHKEMERKAESNKKSNSSRGKRVGST